MKRPAKTAKPKRQPPRMRVKPKVLGPAVPEELDLGENEEEEIGVIETKRGVDGAGDSES